MGLFFGLFRPSVVRAQDAECAEVKIIIEQKLSLERQAFDARMVIRNGLSDQDLKNVKVDLTFLDQNQQPVRWTADPNAVGATFFQRLDTIQGLAAVDASASLARNTTANIHWLIIPSQGAGGDSPNGKLYYVGAKVTYTLNGVANSVDITPDYVIVKPQPLLLLDYFLPTDVHGDDPFTPDTEPAEPFTLGVRINNVGAGEAVKTQIESAQPKIVENKQGLLIDFKILGGYVGNEMQGKSLLLNFGNIGSKKSRMGRWVMETSLSGRFVEFNASYAHADSLGGAVTSLIQDIRTHKLVHDVLVDLPGHDDVADFLAESGSDVRVYDSLGGDADVINASKSASLSSANGNWGLAFTPSAGLVHAKVEDPFQGSQAIARVVRSDGKVLPRQNYWLSKSRNADLSWSYFVHVFDSNSTGKYLFEFGSGGKAGLSGYAYFDLNGNGIKDPAEAALGNLNVTLKGVEDGGRAVVVQGYTDPSGAFAFSGLGAGRYQLHAAAIDGWVDGAWRAGQAGGLAIPGGITDIVLGAGVNASGYQIAKRRPGADDGMRADLSIAVRASRAQLKVGESVSLTVTARNAGEATAQAAVVEALVPDGLSISSSNASVGSYAQGLWTIGALAKDQSATLTLEARALPLAGTASKHISWPISVGSSTTDPALGNNSGLVGLTITSNQAGTAELRQEVLSQAHLLMLVSCPLESVSGQPACEAGVTDTARSLLGGQVRSLAVETSMAAWRIGLRSGRYNMLWLHAGADKLDAQMLAELRAAVRRGATLIVDGVQGPANAGDAQPAINTLADVMGARLVRPEQGTGLSIRLAQDTTGRAVVGPVHRLADVSSGANIMAHTVANPVEVMARHAYGRGQAWVSGWDLLRSAANDSVWGGYVVGQVSAFVPVTSVNPALAGSAISVQSTVQNNAASGDPQQNFDVKMQWPTGMGYTDAMPAPAQADAQSVRWALAVPSGQAGTAALTLQLGQASAKADILTSLTLVGQPNAIDTKTLSITIENADSLAAAVDGALAGLTGTTAATSNAIGQAKDAVAAAKTAQQAGDWAAALQALARLQAALEQLAAPVHGLSIDSLRLLAAQWMGAAQMRWSDTGTGASAKVMPHSGSGQTAELGKAYAQPLVAMVTDAQGRPMAGVPVRFDMPTGAGANATFAGAGASVQAVTNAQGLASTPLMTAGTVVGAFQVSARVDGVSSPALFALTNLSGTGSATPSSMRLVSGGDQSTAVQSAFAVPVVVNVLDAAQKPVPNVNVVFVFATQGASARFAGGQSSVSALTDSDGLVQAPPFVANEVAGAHVLQVSVAGLAQSLQVPLTNTAIVSGVILQSVQGNGQSALVTQPYAQTITVRVVDAQGKPRSGIAVQFTLPAQGPSGVFASGGISEVVTSATDGLASSSIVTANAAVGAFRLTATAQGATSPAHFELTNTAASGRQFIGNTATGTGAVAATVSGGGAACNFNPSATRMAPPDGVPAVLNKLILPHGLFEFELVGCTPGGEVTVQTTWPNLRGITGFLKYGKNASSGGRDVWYVPRNLRIHGNTVTYTIRDGDWGDDDLVTNGVIRDPGGPVIAATQAIPSLGFWGGLLLAMLVLGVGAGRLRGPRSCPSIRWS